MAIKELARDPLSFLKASFSIEKDPRRRRILRATLTCAFAIHIALLVLAATSGWHKKLLVAQPQEEQISWVRPPIKESASTGSPARMSQERSEPSRGGGGGGGGQKATRPASKGALPQMVPLPQIVRLNPSNIPTPSLPLPTTIIGPESPPPPPNQPLGDPAGVAGNFSPGPGTGGGIGPGRGTGVGLGEGPGAGPGKGGGMGGGNNPDKPSTVPAEIDWRLSKPPGFSPFKWIYRARPIVTPEAQANKVSGEVLLRATFRADGRITDIEVVRPVEYMTESAIEALERSRFRPAMINGVPVTLRNVLVRIKIEVEEVHQ